MELSTTLSHEELHRAVKLISISSFRQFKKTWTYRWLAGVSILVVVGLGVSALTLVNNSVHLDHFSFMLMLVLFTGYTMLFRLITAEFYKYIVYNSKRFTGAVRFKLADDSLFAQDGSIISQFKFDSFCKVEDTKEFLLLYIDVHQAVIIPKKTDEARRFAAYLSNALRPVQPVKP